MWSSDKRYVVAFHSSAEYGFTVGNAKGKELFIYTKSLEKNFDMPSVAQWAPNSSALAVLVQDDTTRYDLFVVWGFDDAVRVTSVQIPSIDAYAIAWDEAGRTVYLNGEAIMEIDESGYGHHIVDTKGDITPHEKK